MNNESSFFEEVIFQTTGGKRHIKDYQFVTGGCINHTLKLKTEKGDFFIKWGKKDAYEMYLAEAKGLSLLDQKSDFQIPTVFGVGVIGDKSYLLMEFVKSASPKADYWKILGRNLAKLHRQSSRIFGLSFDNFIGNLPQQNQQDVNWIDFFINNRLEVQLDLALKKGMIDDEFHDQFQRIYRKFESILPIESPALLHGDLWSGNVMIGSHGLPCLVDPAVYYGNREIELAFTQLFGGFDAEFYQAYNDAFPILPGFEERVAIYNLYPLLVHANLFGASYLESVKSTIRKLV